MASEIGTGQTGRLRFSGVVDSVREPESSRRESGKAPPKRVKAPYAKEEGSRSIQSTTRHEKPCGKPGGPPSKPKYEPVTDSVEVL